MIVRLFIIHITIKKPIRGLEFNYLINNKKNLRIISQEVIKEYEKYYLFKYHLILFLINPPTSFALTLGYGGK